MFRSIIRLKLDLLECSASVTLFIVDVIVIIAIVVGEGEGQRGKCSRALSNVCWNPLKTISNVPAFVKLGGSQVCVLKKARALLERNTTHKIGNGVS